MDAREGGGAGEGEGRRIGEGMGKEKHGKMTREGRRSKGDEGGGGARRQVEDASQVHKSGSACYSTSLSQKIYK